MSKLKVPVIADREATSPNRRRFSDEFKQDAVRLVVDEGYSFKAAAQAVGVSEKSLRDWHKKLAPPAEPCGADATLEELREDLEAACRNTVATAMRELGLTSRVSKAFKPTTTQVDPTRRAAANKLDRDFTAEAPNRKWVGDIRHLPVLTGWVYLAVVMDLFSRKAIGWSISTSLATELVSHALRQAIEQRRPDGKRLLHHSDRGCQYTSDAYQRTLRTLGIQCSMSRTGCCYDNAVMERFFWSLKHEWTKHETFASAEEARLSVFKYIETFYNPVRIHQTLGYLTPDQYEAENAAAVAA